MKMKAYRYYAPLDIRYEETEIPDISDDEVLVKVDSALTCGTDVKTFRRGHPVLIKTTPSGFGHEFSGVISQIGKNVENFKVGDRVVAVNSAPCGECFFCKKGQYNLCDNLEFLNGAYAEYIKIPSLIVKKNLYKIPENLTFEEAAFLEPLSNVMHGIEKTNIQPGDTVGIYGLGPIGLMFAALSKLKGAKVIAAGRNPQKLKLAKDFANVDEVIDLKSCKDDEKAFLSFTEEKRGLDIAIECVGQPYLWEKMFNITRKGGTVHFFGGCVKGSSVNIDTKKLHYDEVKILSVFHHTPEYVKKSLDFISSKKVDFTKLISKTLPLEKVDEAIQAHINGDVIKILIKP